MLKKSIISISTSILISSSFLSSNNIPTCTSISETNNYIEYKNAYQLDGIPVNISLLKGWNLVSFTGISNPDVESLFNTYSNIYAIFKFNTSTNLWQKVLRTDSSKSMSIDSKDGVWIYTTSSGTIDCIKANAIDPKLEDYISKIFLDNENLISEKEDLISGLEINNTSLKDQLDLYKNISDSGTQEDVEKYTFINSVSGTDNITFIEDNTDIVEKNLYLNIGVPSEYSSNKHLQLLPTIELPAENSNLNSYITISFESGITPFKYKTGESLSTKIIIKIDQVKIENDFPGEIVTFPVKINLNNGNPNSEIIKNIVVNPAIPSEYDIIYYNGPEETKIISGDGEMVNLKYKVVVTNKENISNGDIYAKITKSAVNIDSDTLTQIPDTILLEEGGTDYKILPIDIDFKRNPSLNQSGSLTLTIRLEDEVSNTLVQNWEQNPKTPDPKYNILQSTSSISISPENTNFTISGEVNIVESGGYIEGDSVVENMTVSVISGSEYLSSPFDEETQTVTIDKIIAEDQTPGGKGNFIFPYSFDGENLTDIPRQVIMKVEIPGKTETPPSSLLYTIVQEPAIIEE